jgi:uncharacterized protein (TIGR02246 family)
MGDEVILALHSGFVAKSSQKIGSHGKKGREFQESAALSEEWPLRTALFISAIAAISLAASASAQQVDQNTRQQIEKIVAANQDAENKQDAAAIAGRYTQDGVLVSPFRRPLVTRGRQEIEKAYKEAFKAIQDRHIEIKVDDVSPLGTNAAVGVGNFEVTGKGQNGAVKVDGDWTAVWVNDGGEWKVRLLTVFTPPSPPK